VHRALLPPGIRAFFDHYVKRAKMRAPTGVTALTQTCPVSAPSEGPYTAATWAKLHRGEVAYRAGSAQTIVSTASDPAVSSAFDPVFGGRACTTAPAL